MDKNEFKDGIFNVINESDEFDLADIVADDDKDKMTITVADGSVFELQISKLE